MLSPHDCGCGWIVRIHRENPRSKCRSPRLDGAPQAVRPLERVTSENRPQAPEARGSIRVPPDDVVVHYWFFGSGVVLPGGAALGSTYLMTVPLTYTPLLSSATTASPPASQTLGRTASRNEPASVAATEPRSRVPSSTNGLLGRMLNTSKSQPELFVGAVFRLVAEA
jgi:hypothetical protein